MDVKCDINVQTKIKGNLNSAFGELINTDADMAYNLSEWILLESQTMKKHMNGERFQKLPDSMKKGDIVLVKFGINVGAELSDVGEDSDGHFGLIWGQQGQQFIVIPLTKTPQPKDNKYGVNIGVISGLPKRRLSDGTFEDIETYAKIDAIRSVHLRRIFRIKGIEHGKTTI